MKPIHNRNLRSKGHLLATLSCAGVVLLLSSNRLLAAEPSVGASAGSETPGQLEEVLVTAQRRSENLQRVPITVDTVAGADAAALGTTSIQTLAETVPNLSYAGQGTFVNTYIRGVGDTSAVSNNESSTAVYVDGVYNPSPYAMTALPFNNLQQISVLKGPQGTLFGRNATAGVIQITTPDPQQRFSGKLDVGYGNYNTYSSDGYVTGGITSDLAADMAVLFFDQVDGVGISVPTGTPTFRSKNIALRTKWLWTPSDATQVRLSVDYADYHNDGVEAQFVPGSTPPYPGDYNIAGLPGSTYIEQKGASVTVDQDLGEQLHLQSISAFRYVGGDSVLDGNLRNATSMLYSHWPANYWSQEVHLQNRNPGRITWMVGAFYLGSQVFAADPWLSGGSAIKPNGYSAAHGSQDLASGSVFAQATADLGWNTDLTLGARYTDETVKAFGRTQNQAGQIIAGPFFQEIRDDPLTWRVAVDHHFTADTMAYISFNKGFKTGGFNLSAPGSAPFYPEHLDAYETGIKTEFLDHRLRLNASFFYYDYTDIQVAISLGGAQLFLNAAGARNYGEDSSVDFVATDHLTLSLGTGLVHARFTNYPNARGYTPAGVLFPIPNARGDKLPYVAAASGYLIADYHTPTPIGKITGLANLSYTDDSCVTPDCGLVMPTHFLVNASVELRPAGHDSWAVRLWGKNLSNDYYDIFASEGGLGWYRVPAMPRTYGIAVEKDF